MTFSCRCRDRRRCWIVVLEGSKRRWGGDLRRQHIFRRLAERTDATLVRSWSPRPLERAVKGRFGLRGLLRGRPRLAASEQLWPPSLEVARRLTEPVAVAVYDDAVAQMEALGVELPAERVRLLRARRDANLALFRWYVVPTASFAELVRLDSTRVIVGGNGTDTRHIRPGEWPGEPTVGMISGAHPGRGIESLIEASRLARSTLPDLRLLLWLASTGDESEAYLQDLSRRVAAEHWIELATAPYEHLGNALRRARLLCIPHPPGDYMEVALPVKLFDSMAAGRPLLVTPRREMEAVVRRHEAGLVAGGDRAEDLAERVVSILSDDALAMRLGENARRAAERYYDWRVVGDALATAILSRER